MKSARRLPALPHGLAYLTYDASGIHRMVAWQLLEVGRDLVFLCLDHHDQPMFRIE
jgi:hypothetical protein